MSNAEQERIEKAWEDWLHKPGYFSTKEAFEGGYTGGRADALVLPEVRAEELVRGAACLMRSVGVREWSFYRCGRVGAFIGAKVEFRGPLPLMEK